MFSSPRLYKSELLLLTGSCFSEIIALMRGPCLSSAKVNSPVVDKVNIIWVIKRLPVLCLCFYLIRLLYFQFPSAALLMYTSCQARKTLITEKFVFCKYADP